MLAVEPWCCVYRVSSSPTVPWRSEGGRASPAASLLQQPEGSSLSAPSSAPPAAERAVPCRPGSSRTSLCVRGVMLLGTTFPT